MILPKETDIFHVHTFRCLHAEVVPDEAYVKKAISLGASGIYFSDHAPFPNDIFGHRMKMAELEEYISTLKNLKNEYGNVIDIHIGLEIEYFPSFIWYYEKLRKNSEIEFLLLGQHMAEYEPNHYTFSFDKDKLAKEEFIFLGNALTDGINSGFFDAIAHPDRIFRKCSTWTKEMSDMSSKIIQAACDKDLPLEINISSKFQEHAFWNEFWELVPDTAKRIVGLDAHSVAELM